MIGKEDLLLDKIYEEVEEQGDDLFIGAGNGRLIENYKVPESYSEQIMENSTNEVDIPVINDLSRFESEKIRITSDETYKILFVSGKKKAYGIFDYLSVKSMNVEGAPRKEEDLILEEEDFHIIDELKLLTKDYFAIFNLAVMNAYLEMGIGEVKFKQKDGCPLCKALDGHIFGLHDVLNLICSNRGITHKYCDCDFLPVIRREQSYGILDGKLDIPEFETDSNHVGGKQIIINMPVEMSVGLIENINHISNHIIEFLNIKEYLNDNGIESSPGTVVFEDSEGILFVHNSYVGILGPIDFLRVFRSKEECLQKISPDELKGMEVLYYKGKRIVEYKGKYWNLETGEEVRNI